MLRPVSVAVALAAGGAAWWAAHGGPNGLHVTPVLAAAVAALLALLASTAPRRAGAALAAAGATVLAAAVMTQSRDAPVVVLLGAIVGAGAGVIAGRRAQGRGRVGRTIAAGAVATASLAAMWVGANSSTAGWFGPQVAHGDRRTRVVALTFDDGPNDTATLAIRDVLDRYGARGTFFSVGKAIDARPAVTAALAADGHLVENHSYSHDSLRWLDPRYPELQRADAAIHRSIGRCPAFYRAPHGQHTPFLASVVGRHHMTMIGWDDSAGDWATTNPQVVAGRILRKARPGSIIDLHDGLDGRPAVDRSVLVEAMPLILDGLQARDLRAVGLDELLGRPAYRACGPAG